MRWLNKSSSRNYDKTLYRELWTFMDIYKNDDILEEHLLLLD